MIKETPPLERLHFTRKSQDLILQSHIYVKLFDYRLILTFFRL